MKMFAIALLVMISASAWASPRNPVSENKLRALIGAKCKAAAKKAALSAFLADPTNRGRRYGGIEAEVGDPGEYMVTIEQDSDEGDETYSVNTRVDGVRNLGNGTYDASRIRCTVTGVDHT